MRIVFSNFYPMVTARRKHASGVYPSQYLFAGPALEAAGHDVDYVEPGSGWLRPLLDTLTRKLSWQLGDLAPQASTLRRARGADVIFGAADEALSALALLRSAGLLKKPVAAVVHHPPRHKWLVPRAMRGYDLVFTLSEAARERLLEMGRDVETTRLISWGPQLDFAPYALSHGEHYVMSCGKSARDVDTLAAALKATGLRGLIYASPGWEAPAGADIRVRTLDRIPPYPEVMEEMAQASVVAIPLLDADRMYGLSELNDALAMGKPIVMTRSRHIDFDVEEIGCGLTVEIGDVEGWSSALLRLERDPELRRAMGRRAREFAELWWNDGLCGRQIREGLEQLCGEWTPASDTPSIAERRAPIARGEDRRRTRRHGADRRAADGAAPTGAAQHAAAPADGAPATIPARATRTQRHARLVPPRRPSER